MGRENIVSDIFIFTYSCPRHRTDDNNFRVFICFKKQLDFFGLLRCRPNDLDAGH